MFSFFLTVVTFISQKIPTNFLHCVVYFILLSGTLWNRIIKSVTSNWQRIRRISFHIQQRNPGEGPSFHYSPVYTFSCKFYSAYLHATKSWCASTLPSDFLAMTNVILYPVTYWIFTQNHLALFLRLNKNSAKCSETKVVWHNTPAE